MFASETASHKGWENPNAIGRKSQGFGNRILQQEVFTFKGAEALPFMPDSTVIGCVGRTGKPAFIDPTAMCPKGIIIIGMQF